MMKVLNLYAGIGGNRKLWKNVEVTAVELNEKVAAIYHEHFPQDRIVIADAHEYLRRHFREFDFIWSSPPCQSHSRLSLFQNQDRQRRFPDLKLYEEILFLRYYSRDQMWVIENVQPFYDVLIPPSGRAGRHLFWSNFYLRIGKVPKFPGNIANTSKGALMKWIGIYYKGNPLGRRDHSEQAVANCVHPIVGEQILASARNIRSVHQRQEFTFGL